MKKLIMFISLIVGCVYIANAQTANNQKQQYAEKIVNAVEKEKTCTTSNGTKGTWVTTSRDVRTVETTSNSNTRNSGSYSSHTSASVNASLTNFGINAQNGVSHNSGNSSRSNGTTITREVNEHQVCVEKKR